MHVMKRRSFYTARTERETHASTVCVPIVRAMRKKFYLHSMFARINTRKNLQCYFFIESTRHQHPVLTHYLRHVGITLIRPMQNLNQFKHTQSRLREHTARMKNE